MLGRQRFTGQEGRMAHERALTRMLAARLSGAHYGTLPDDATEVAKQCLLDFIGVTLAGSDEPLTRILQDDQRESGGNPQASLIGLCARATTEQAALINGAASHAHDYDDVHSAMYGHPTVPVAPAALALAEYLDKSGIELLTAFAKGVDTECIVGRYLGPSHYAAGWHATATLGALGAAAACASLLGLDERSTARALGIATTQAAGLKAQFGTMCKPLHAGHAAATGLVAARLAARGFTSREDMLETGQGLAATQSTTADAGAFEAAMARTSFLPDVCFKYHAACYLTHSSIDAARSLALEHKLRPDDVREVEVTVDRGHFGVCNIEQPATGLEAKFSLRFTTAMALAGIDTASIDVFTDELTQRPDLVTLRDRVRVVAWEQPRPGSRVRIQVRGSTLEAEANVAIPMRDLEAQWVRLEGKFHALVDGRLGVVTADRIVALCRDLDRQPSLAPLLALIGGSADD
jgi:2-methylcitrate dehydratase PrpD